MLRFTYDYLRTELEAVRTAGYDAVTCRQYAEMKRSAAAMPPKVWVNRVDVDFSLKKADRLRTVFSDVGIRGTFFIRLHAPEYNPFDFENYRILCALRDDGHELGYHSEIVDQAAVWGEDPAVCLSRDLDVLARMLDTEIVGVASHGGLTGLNNLDFWKDHRPGEFGLHYEAYDREPGFNLFQESFYVSDSEWNRWKCYDRGRLVEGDRRPPSAHAQDGHAVLHTLVHPDTYYTRHFYE